MKRIIRKYRPFLILSIFFYIVCAIIETYFAIILGNVIDAATNFKTTELTKNAVIAAGLLIISLGTYSLALLFRSIHVKKCISSTKNHVYKRIINARGDKDNAYLLNLLSSDMDQVESNYLLPLAALYLDSAKFVFAVLALLL